MIKIIICSNSTASVHQFSLGLIKRRWHSHKAADFTSCQAVYAPVLVKELEALTCSNQAISNARCSSAIEHSESANSPNYTTL